MPNKLEPFYLKLGENIRQLRTQRKIKQAVIASHLGLSRISISNIESGTQRIQLHYLQILAKLLQVSLDELLPNMENLNTEITNKLEKKISNTEISNNPESLGKVKDFILFSKSSKTTP